MYAGGYLSDHLNMSVSPFQGVAAGAGILFLFLVVSRTPDFIGIAGVALIVGVAALIAIGLSGGMAKSLTSKPGLFFIAFTVWLCICLPFSVWKGGSFELLKDTWSRSLLAFIIVGGSLVTLGHLRKALYTMAIAAIAILGLAFKFATADSGRLSFTQGTLANPNDMAAYLLMTVPFCLFVFMESRNGFVKAGMVIVSLMLLVMTLRTGSRSGLVNIGILGAYMFFTASFRIKLLMGTAALAMVIAAPLYLTDSVIGRFRTMVEDQVASSSGSTDPQDRQSDFAEASTQSRTQLFRKSIEITLSNPVLGVGPGMFAVASSDLAKIEGDRAQWQQTHNTFTQVSSETGLPGLLIFLGLIFTIFRATRTPAEWADSPDPNLRLLRNVGYTLRLALISFCGGGLFGSLAYGMQLPILGGLAETLRRALESRRQQSQAPAVARPPARAVPVRPLVARRMRA